MSEREAAGSAVAPRLVDFVPFLDGVCFRPVWRNMFERSSRRAETNNFIGFCERRFVKASGSGSVPNGPAVFVSRLQASCPFALSLEKAFSICLKNPRQ